MDGIQGENNTRTIKTAEILCVGTELLLGDIVNTNAAYLSRQLAALGINVYRQSVVGDNPGRLGESLRESMSRADLVITSGGLGPTCDDLTKETVAGVLGKKLVLHSESLENIKSYFSRRNITMTENNKKQAMMPDGSEIFKNNFGTAPGFAVLNEDGTKTVIMLPGPPRELIPMFEHEVAPYLSSRTDSVLRSRNIHIIGMGESAVENHLHGMMENGMNPTVAPYAKEGEVLLRVTAKGTTEDECFGLCDKMVEDIKRTPVGEFIYGIDIGSLEAAVVAALSAAAKTVAFAESCTGGLISKRIVDISGASSVFLGSIICYSNQSKIKLLGVPAQIIEQYGAVSEQTAVCLAKGVRERLGSDFGVSVTGIAGPSGGTPDKPVGLVYICISGEHGERCIRLDLGGRDRSYTRHVAASHALNLLLSEIK